MHEDIPESLLNYHREILKRYFSDNGLPRWTPVLFARGANNLLYRFDYKAKPAVAKIGINPLYRQLHYEKEALRHIGKTGPGVIDFFVDGEDAVQVLILEYIEGTHPFTLNEEQLVNIGLVIAGYHGDEQRVPELPVETYHEFLANRILPVANTGAEGEHYCRFQDLYTLSEACAETLKEKLLSCRSVLVHGDLIPENILVDTCGFLRIIDWEGVRYDAPEADIATLIKSFQLTGEQLALVLKGYGAPLDERVLRYRLLVHYLQVIAWRLAVQLPREKELQRDHVLAELEEELAAAEEMAGRLKAEGGQSRSLSGCL